jgi:hypothetical protein
MLAGLSKNQILSVPPYFCASVGAAALITINNAAAAASLPGCRFMPLPPAGFAY